MTITGKQFAIICAVSLFWYLWGNYVGHLQRKVNFYEKTDIVKTWTQAQTASLDTLRSK